MINIKIINEKKIYFLLFGLILLLGSCKKSEADRDESVDYSIKQHLAAKTVNIPPNIKAEIAEAAHIDELNNVSIESQKWMHDTLADVDNPQLVEKLMALYNISDGGTMRYLMMECLRKFLRDEEIDSAKIMKSILKSENERKE